jgi:hypothetical protein
MAATKGRKPNFIMTHEPQFYVYQFVVDGVPKYIGKGTGRRLKNQERNFGMPGEIVKWFKSEKAAYDFEFRLIAKHRPAWNVVAGGGGAVTRKRDQLPAWIARIHAEMRRVGSRVYAARELLKLDLGNRITPEQMAMLRRVAAGV